MQALDEQAGGVFDHFRQRRIVGFSLRFATSCMLSFDAGLNRSIHAARKALWHRWGRQRSCRCDGLLHAAAVMPDSQGVKFLIASRMFGHCSASGQRIKLHRQLVFQFFFVVAQRN